MTARLLKRAGLLVGKIAFAGNLLKFVEKLLLLDRLSDRVDLLCSDRCRGEGQASESQCAQDHSGLPEKAVHGSLLNVLPHSLTALSKAGVKSRPCRDRRSAIPRRRSRSRAWRPAP